MLSLLNYNYIKVWFYNCLKMFVFEINIFLLTFYWSICQAVASRKNTWIDKNQCFNSLTSIMLKYGLIIVQECLFLRWMYFCLTLSFFISMFILKIKLLFLGIFLNSIQIYPIIYWCMWLFHYIVSFLCNMCESIFSTLFYFCVIFASDLYADVWNVQQNRFLVVFFLFIIIDFVLLNFNHYLLVLIRVVHCNLFSFSFCPSPSSSLSLSSMLLSSLLLLLLWWL